MKIIWDVTKQDAAPLRELIARFRDTDVVRDRITRNLGGNMQPPSLQEIWRVIVGCLATTQQRSGPNSQVSRFLEQRPFPLAYAVCKEMDRNLEKGGAQVLAKAGIWRAKMIGRQMQQNLAALEEHLWPELRDVLDKLQPDTAPDREREAARFVANHLEGFGPKQSRNFLQWLGLTRYETPIDSRVTKWLNRHGFPLELNAAGLADEHYYCLVADGFQALCAKAGVLPCIADAAIFASFDTKTPHKAG